MIEKTNVMRIFDRMKIPYRIYTYEGGALSGTEVAAQLCQDCKKVFKTLVTVSKSLRYYVFMIPVAAELDLKKAASCVGEKALSMLKSKELLPLTGYVHGGCSPVGMKKYFPTVIDRSALHCDTIIFSGGKIGYQVETTLGDLQRAVKTAVGDLVVGTADGETKTYATGDAANGFSEKSGRAY